jgi:hypothetical protein
MLNQFFCKACLVDKPLTEQSRDPRYCLDCFGFLVEEAARLANGSRPAWVPRPILDVPIKPQQPLLGLQGGTLQGVAPMPKTKGRGRPKRHIGAEGLEIIKSYSIKQAAEMLDVGIRTVCRLRKESRGRA